MTVSFHVDEFSPTWIAGWIDDGGPVHLTILVNTRQVAYFLANNQRDGLNKGDDKRGFSFHIAPHLTEYVNTVVVKYGSIILRIGQLMPVNEAARLAAGARSIARNKDFLLPSNEVTFLQTSDATNYLPMLQITSRTVLAYCQRHDMTCQLHIGLCRGSAPWHATFNRITILRNMLNNGYSGWVCYIDADGFITNLDFDLRQYLADKGNTALIITSDDLEDKDRPYWAVNAGTFLINLAHPVGKEIIWNWADKLDLISDEQFSKFDTWQTDDQELLTNVLSHLSNGGNSILTLHDYPNLLNYSHGSFISQILRADMSFAERVEQLKRHTDHVLEYGRLD